jgi:hypothetical protein
VWHERIPTWSIKPAGVNWDAKGRFKVKLADNEDKQVTFEIPAALIKAE